MVCCRIFTRLILWISQTPGLFSQEAFLFPSTPAYVTLQKSITFQCMSSIRTDWRSTSFYDETYNNGVPSIALFNKATDGTCRVSSVSNIKYEESCDASGGVFNLTIRSVDGWYHNQYIRCRVQFGNGTSTDIYTTANSTIYVMINILRVIVTSDNITSDINSNVAVRCNATSRPVAAVHWVKTDSEGNVSDITSSSSYTVSRGNSGDTISSLLTFKFTPLDNQGQLYCQAGNNISTENSSLISLHIQYPPTADPTIQQTPVGAIVTGSKVVLTCTLSGGNPPATLLWNCSGNMTQHTQGDTYFNQLTFMVDKNDDGKACNCLASHSVSTYKRNIQVKLVVHYPPDDTPIITQTPVGAITTGTPALLTCLLKGGNPVASLSWNCTGTVTSNSSESTASCSIEIIVNRQNHGVVCSCFATHSVGNYREAAHHVLDVIYPPDDIPVINQAPPGPIDADSPVELICSVYGGNPLPNLSWDCAGRITSNSSESTAFSTVLFTVDKNYNGRVCTCSASHSISTYRPKVQHELIAYYRPNITKIESLNDLIVRENHTATLQCHVESNPLPNITWLFDRKALQSDQEVTVSNLTISRVQCYNTGTYLCVATNSINGKIVEAIKEVKLYIGCKPRVNIKYNSLPMVIAVEEKRELNVTVNLIGYPPPVTKWIFNKVTKTTEITNGIEHSSTLFIANVSSEDLGEYTVYSSNDYGHLFIHLSLTMKGVPNAPYDVVIVCDSQSITVLWKPEFNGGDLQTFYILYWSDSINETTSNIGQDELDSKTLHYVIKSLTPNTSYKLKMVTSNSYGKAESQIFECTTDNRDQLSQYSGNDVVNMIVGITMLSTGVVLAISALLHFACHCRKQINENTKSEACANHITSTGDNLITKEMFYATTMQSSVENRCYDSLTCTSEIGSIALNESIDTYTGESEPVYQNWRPVDNDVYERLSTKATLKLKT